MEPQDTERVEGMVAAVDGLLDALRRISLELRPAVLDALGLEAAAEWLVEELGRRTGLEVRLSADLGGREVDRDRAVALYRILQEALTNVARHAEARRVQVQLGAEGDEVVLVVRDDGRGLPAEGSLPPSRLGLLGMRERAHALGGFTAVASQPGQGTRIEARLPLETTRGEPAEP
jgi:signal transduction histidine kinase